MENLETYIHTFLRSLDIRASSKQTYQRQIKEFLVWYKKCNIISLAKEDMIAYKEYLRDEKNLTPLTIAGYLTAIRRLFDWLESEKICFNIAKGIKGPKRKKGFKKDVLTLEQVKKLLDSIDKLTLAGKRDYAMLNLMVRTGLRTIEIIRANKEDLCTQSGMPVLMIQGKGRDSKDDMVILTESALNPIREYLKARVKVKDQDPLFVSVSTKNHGKRLTTRSISRIVKNRFRDIGLDDSRLTAHSLRHTAITFSLMAGATVQEAKTMARHADINTTMIYAHNIDRIKQAPEKKIDDLLK
ncbi:site-specific integrase [Candidatus Dependentiae bacterium]|nr:site-specific integrase [Candidatus Dependentiae bacterium]